MRLAILSDIHANLPALEAVLADVEGAGLAEVWCLGDVVGYGALRPVPRRKSRPRGARRARRLLLLTCGRGRRSMDAGVGGRRDARLPAGAQPADESRDVALYHASPRDPVWEYVLWPDQAAECIAVQAARISLIGHSHVALFFVMGEDRRPAAAKSLEPDDAARGAQAGAGTRLDLSEGSWLVNPGSVGQPRDGDPRAAWLELDTDSWEATYHRVEYEIDRAAAAIEATDLPEHLARRLYVGQ